MSEPTLRAKVRAAVLAAVIAVHGIDAAPLPQRVTPNDLRNPTAAEEVARWSERLGALGWPISPEDLGQSVISVSGAIAEARGALLAPFRPVLRATGTGQGWGLFANPDTHPDRLVVRGHDAAGWRILYQRLDPEHDWDHAVLVYRRVRALGDSGGNRGRPSPTFQRFAAWVGRRALAAFPELDAVEVGMVRTHTTPPGRPPDPRTEPRHSVTTRRTP